MKHFIHLLRKGGIGMAESLHELFAAHRLTPAQRRTAAYLTSHGDQAASLTSTELAEHAGVSQASVTRFVTMLGFERYAAFRRHLHALADTRPPTDGEHSTKFQQGTDEDVRNLAAKIHPDVRVLSGGSVLGDQLRHAQRRGAHTAIVFALPRYPREAQDALRKANGLGLHTVLVSDKAISALTPDADAVLTAEVVSEFVFDSQAAVMSLSAALLETMADAVGTVAQQRLENFEEYVAQKEIFLSD